MIFKRDLEDSFSKTMNRHVKRNKVLYVGTNTPIEIQTPPELNWVDISFYLEQTWYERLHSIFVKGPKAFWREISVCHWRMPKGGEIKKDLWKDLGLDRGDREATEITVRYRSWGYHIRHAFKDWWFWIKEACKKYVWIDWVITIHTDDYVNRPKDPWESDEEFANREEPSWSVYYPIRAFTTNDEICEAVKKYVNQKGFVIDIQYKKVESPFSGDDLGLD